MGLVAANLGVSLVVELLLADGLLASLASGPPPRHQQLEAELRGREDWPPLGEAAGQCRVVPASAAAVVTRCVTPGEKCEERDPASTSGDPSSSSQAVIVTAGRPLPAQRALAQLVAR